MADRQTDDTEGRIALGGALDFTGKTAFVTGASRGIGRVIARHLASAGAFVFVGFSRDEDGATKTLRDIAAAGSQGAPAQGNLASTDEVRAIFERIGAAGPLDILVHNAALGSFKPLLDVRANQWDLTMSVTTRALLLCARLAVPLMAGRRGRIVGVSSLGSARVIPSYGAIGVSKAALESLTRCLAVECAPHGIGVNAVSAGLVDTASVRQHPDFDRLAARAGERSLSGGLVSAAAVARTVLFLCSPLADEMFGQTLVVDGGMSLAL
jgi:enoyl-[acyl-carrier protein] reductase III